MSARYKDLSIIPIVILLALPLPGTRGQDADAQRLLLQTIVKQMEISRENIVAGCTYDFEIENVSYAAEGEVHKGTSKGSIVRQYRNIRSEMEAPIVSMQLAKPFPALILVPESRTRMWVQNEQHSAQRFVNNPTVTRWAHHSLEEVSEREADHAETFLPPDLLKYAFGDRKQTLATVVAECGKVGDVLSVEEGTEEGVGKTYTVRRSKQGWGKAAAEYVIAADRGYGVIKHTTYWKTGEVFDEHEVTWEKVADANTWLPVRVGYRSFQFRGSARIPKRPYYLSGQSTMTILNFKLVREIPDATFEFKALNCPDGTAVADFGIDGQSTPYVIRNGEFADWNNGIDWKPSRSK